MQFNGYETIQLSPKYKKLPEPDYSNLDKPNVWTLYKDNLATAACFTGTVVAALPAAAVGVAIGIPGALFCEPGFGMACGASVFGAIAIPVGLVTAPLFSFPFAALAEWTRKFQSNTQIDPYVNFIAECIDKDDRTQIIREIYKYDNEENTYSFRSYSSRSLLNSGSWEDLIKYMTEKNADGKYVHNGKRLFNTILQIFKNKFEDTQFVLRQAIQEENLDAIERLIACDKDILESPHTIKALHYAVSYNKEKVVKLLLTKNVNVNALSLFEKNSGFFMPTLTETMTAITLAAELGHKNIVNLLRNASAEVASEAGLLPIHIGARNGNLSLVENELRQDPNYMDSQDNMGNTPLMLAAANNKMNVVKYLVDRRADLDKKTHDTSEKKGKSALDLASEKRHENIANYLSERRAHDPQTIRNKEELKTILSIAHSDEWNDKGQGLFSRKVPTRIAALRDLKIDISKIDSLSRAVINKHIQTIKNTIAEESFFSNAHSKKFYALINTIGANKETDYQTINGNENATFYIQRLSMLGR